VWTVSRFFLRPGCRWYGNLFPIQPGDLAKMLQMFFSFPLDDKYNVMPYSYILF
jgi:hypothetical protein